VLQYKANEDVIEGCLRERQPEDVGGLEGHIAEPGACDGGPGGGDRGRGGVNGCKTRLRIVLRKDDRLGADAAASFQHLALGRKGCIMMQ